MYVAQVWFIYNLNGPEDLCTHCAFYHMHGHICIYTPSRTIHDSDQESIWAPFRDSHSVIWGWNPRICLSEQLWWCLHCWWDGHWEICWAIWSTEQDTLHVEHTGYPFLPLLVTLLFPSYCSFFFTSSSSTPPPSRNVRLIWCSDA